MSIYRNLAKAASTALNALVLTSAPTSAAFSYLAWQEAALSSPDLTAAANNTARIAELTADAREHEIERLTLQRAMLASLDRLLPAAEKIRLGFDRLIASTEQQLKNLHQGRTQPAPQLPKPDTKVSALAPTVAGWSKVDQSPEPKKEWYVDFFRNKDDH